MVRTRQNGAWPLYIRTLLDEVLSQSRCPLIVVEQAGIGYDSQLRMACARQPFHLLAIVPAYHEYALHFVVNAVFKIRRMWELPPQERVLPVAGRERCLPADDEAELRRKLGKPPEDLVHDMSRFLYQGIVQQLTSMPLDIRVEREIAEELPQHGEAQFAYLARQVGDLEATFEPKIAQVTPARVYTASTAMNVVLTDEAARIAAVRPGPLYHRSPHRELGRRLGDILISTTEHGYRGDRRVTDAWAEELGMRDWYEWKHPDEVR